MHVENKNLDMVSLEEATLNEVSNATGSPGDNVLPGSKHGFITADVSPADASVAPHVYRVAESFENGVYLACEDFGLGEYEHYRVRIYCCEGEGNKHWVC